MNSSNLPSNDPASGNPSTGFTGDAANAIGTAKQAIKDTARDFKQSAKDKVSHLKDAASETATRVKDQAAEAATTQKAGIADRIGGYSSAVHKSAESLEQDDPNIAWVTHQAADRLAQLSDYVRSRDFSELKEDVAGLARRHPVAFFSGAFLAGLVVGNIIKATSRAADSSSESLADQEDSYPQAENVPSIEASSAASWPAGPANESMT